MANSDDAAIDDGLRKQEDAAKRRYDAEKKWQDAIAENKKLAIDSEDAKIKGQQDEANKILETLGKAIADAKGVNGGNAIDEAKQGLDGWKVIKQVAKGRGDKAEQEAIDIENERDKSEAGKHGDSDKSTATRDAQRPSWPVLDRRRWIVSRSPSAAMSSTFKPTSSERRNAPASRRARARGLGCPEAKCRIQRPSERPRR